MNAQFLAVILCVTLIPGGAFAGEQSGSSADVAAIEQKLADLERQIASLQDALQSLRRDVQALGKADKPKAMTPQEAVEAFKKDPKQRFTVEFGVEGAGWPDGPISIDEDPLPPIMADWDNRLQNGGKFTLILTAKAIRGLKKADPTLAPAALPDLVGESDLSAICKRLKGKGVRVTGAIKVSQPEAETSDYILLVDDAADFSINP
jgi:hypothetical protein